MHLNVTIELYMILLLEHVEESIHVIGDKGYIGQ